MTLARPAGMALISVLVTASMPYAAPAGAVEEDGVSPLLFAASVDAMTLYPDETGIRYSTYGHAPAVPLPASSAVTLAWTPEATIPGTFGGPLGGAPLDDRPDLAFDRDGTVFAVWMRLEMGFHYQPCVFDENGVPVPLPFPLAVIYGSRFDGATRTWSAPVQLSGGLTPGLDQYVTPTVAADSAGNAIAAWRYEYVHQHDSCENGGGIHVHHDVEFARWDGLAWTPPATVPGGSTYANVGPAVAFAALLAPAGSATREEAVVAWQDASALDGNGDPLLWRLHYASWDGGAFSLAGAVAPDGMAAGRKMDIAALRGDKVLIGYELVLGGVAHALGHYYSAATDGLVGPAVDNGPGTYMPAVTVRPNNDAHLYYMEYDGAGNPMIRDRLSPAGAAWTNDTLVGDGFEPSAAIAIHHDRIVVGGVGPAGTGLAREGAGAWGDAGIPQGAHHALAAHTGSPNLPHAEWTYAVYASNTHNPLPLAGDRAEMQAVGSSARVNGLTYFKDGPVGAPNVGVRRELAGAARVLDAKYIQESGQTLAPAPDFGDAGTLQRWISWVYEAYPAQRTGLDFWDHGEGWGGGNLDDLPGGVTSQISMPEYRTALDGALGTRDADLLVFSECAMAQLEVAYEVRAFAPWMIASEDCMDADGLEYDDVYGRLQTVPRPAMNTLVAQIVADYGVRYAGAPTPDALSGIDLGDVGAFATSVDALADGITGAPLNVPLLGTVYFSYPARHNAFHAAVLATQVVANGCEVRGCANDYLDLWHLADRVQASFPAPDPVNVLAANVKTALDNVVSPLDQDPATPGVQDHEFHDVAQPYHGLSIYLEFTRADWNANVDAYDDLRAIADTDHDVLVGLYTSPTHLAP